MKFDLFKTARISELETGQTGGQSAVATKEDPAVTRRKNREVLARLIELDSRAGPIAIASMNPNEPLPLRSGGRINSGLFGRSKLSSLAGFPGFLSDSDMKYLRAWVPSGWSSWRELFSKLDAEKANLEELAVAFGYVEPSEQKGTVTEQKVPAKDSATEQTAPAATTGMSDADANRIRGMLRTLENLGAAAYRKSGDTPDTHKFGDCPRPVSSEREGALLADDFGLVAFWIGAASEAAARSMSAEDILKNLTRVRMTEMRKFEY